MGIVGKHSVSYSMKTRKARRSPNETEPTKTPARPRPAWMSPQPGMLHIKAWMAGVTAFPNEWTGGLYPVGRDQKRIFTVIIQSDIVTRTSWKGTDIMPTKPKKGKKLPLFSICLEKGFFNWDMITRVVGLLNDCVWEGIYTFGLIFTALWKFYQVTY